jgi:hypothetical protein
MKISVLLKRIYRFNTIPFEIPMSFFREIEKTILKFKHERPQIAKVILSQKSNAGGTTISDFKLIYSNKFTIVYTHTHTHTHTHTK